MFLGEYQHTLDAKNRVSLPARFRDELTGRLVVSKGLGGCLYVRSAEQFEEAIADLKTGNDFDPDKRTTRLFFAASAAETTLDKAGRINIAPQLRDYAGLAKDVMVVGNIDRIELWDAAAWAAQMQKMDSKIEEMAAGLSAKGIL
jgi:MraZ protein